MPIQPASPHGAARPHLAARRGRRSRLERRAAPLAAVALVALIGGLVAGALHTPPEQRLAERFARAWRAGDYAAMYRMTSASAQRANSVSGFAGAYRQAESTATGLRVLVGRAGKLENGEVAVPMTVRTRIFGVVRGSVRLPFSGSGDAARIDWTPALTFPGLERGDRLGRRTRLAPRAAILARDGEALAKGPDRSSSLSSAATQIVGEVGPIPDELRAQLLREGVPPQANVGISGLERALQTRLAGRPGGELLAGRRVLARTSPRRGHAVTTSIDPKIEEAAVAALGAQYGGVAVTDPRDGEVLALAGVAYSALQPPGSTFKIITATAALDAHAVKLSDAFPVESAAVLSGVRLENANGELCGGTFEESFVHSCNSVFAPLGARLGARRLVATAERFGFNQQPAIDGAATPSIPPANEVGDDLAVGSTAIGQGRVLSTALEMAIVAATIGDLGTRHRASLVRGRAGQAVHVTSPATARMVRRMMVGVVHSGTGTAAAIPGVVVAGKTGTAELGTTQTGQPSGGAAQETTSDTDAWFAAFAPARHPTVAVGVLAVRAGAGGDAAAPIAREVLAAALQRPGR